MPNYRLENKIIAAELKAKPGINGDIVLLKNGQMPEAIAPVKMPVMPPRLLGILEYKQRISSGPNALPRPDQAYKTRL